MVVTLLIKNFIISKIITLPYLANTAQFKTLHFFSPPLDNTFLVKKIQISQFFFSSSTSFGVMQTKSLDIAGTYEVCILIFPGSSIIEVLWTPGPKKGKIFTLKLCFSVTRCVALSPSQKDTSPSSMFNLIRIRSRRCCTDSTTRSFAKAVHTPLLSPIHHTPRFGDSVNFFLRGTTSLHTPTTHEGLSPTITSHRCLPEV